MARKQKQNGYDYILGIDCGMTGGLVALRNGNVVFKELMPTVGKELDYQRIYNILRTFKKKNAVVYCEHIWGRGGGWGATQNFKLGLIYGSIKSMLIATKLPHFFVPATTWQKYSLRGVQPQYKTGKKKKTKDTKAMAVIASQRIFPDVKFTKPKGTKPQDGLVDAALIAYYGMMDVKKT